MPGPTTAANSEVAQLIIGSGTAYDNTNAYLGVGNSNTAYADAQTDLQGTNVRRGMEATYPSESSGTITLKAVFSTDVANFAWEEWGVFNDASAGTMLLREVESLGVKSSGVQWTLTVDVAVDRGT